MALLVRSTEPGVMARKKRGKRGSSSFQVLPVKASVDLGTLAQNAVLTVDLTALGVTEFQTVSMDLTWSIEGMASVDEPVQVGVANGDLSGTEITEKLDANPISSSDVIARERQRRPVRAVGQIGQVGGTGARVMNDGKPIRTRFRTRLATGIELEAWVRNLAAALVTGSTVHINGSLYGYWV